MNHRFFLLTTVFTIALITPLKSFTIKPQEFIKMVYAENKWLPAECSLHIANILEKFKNEQGMVTVNSTIRKWIKFLTFSITKKYHKTSAEYKAALITHRMLNKLQAEQKNVKHECSICLEEIGQHKTELTCSHIFCRPCLLDWFTQDKPETEGSHTTCPLCRKSFAQHVKDSFKKHPSYYKKLQTNLKKKYNLDWTLLFQEQREFNEENRQALLQAFEIAIALPLLLNDPDEGSADDSDSERTIEHSSSESSSDESLSSNDRSDDSSDSEGSSDYPSSEDSENESSISDESSST